MSVTVVAKHKMGFIGEIKELMVEDSMDIMVAIMAEKDIVKDSIRKDERKELEPMDSSNLVEERKHVD